MGLATSFLKKNKQQNVIFTQLIPRYLGEVAMILKESSCSVHLAICMKATLSTKTKIKSLIWKQAQTVDSCTETIKKSKGMTQEILVSILY